MRCVDELFFVSDLHLGGAPGCQVFNQAGLLAALLDQMRTRDPERQVALVLGGDIVDFLASGGDYLKTSADALQILRAILDDPELGQVFAALRRFIGQPRRHLIWLLGNHDLELALPTVQEALIDVLTQGDDAARGRLEFIPDDGGFRCMVGGARVLCTHGNEVDPWNTVDYVALSRRGAMEDKGLSPPEWQTNAGTHLVIDVMNEVKRRYPFVELLKPEGTLVPRLIAVLEPSSLRLLARFAPIAYQLVRGEARAGLFLGSQPDGGESPSSSELMERLLGLPRMPNESLGVAESAGRDAIAQAVYALQAGATPLGSSGSQRSSSAHGRDVGSIPRGEMLGVAQYIVDRVMGKDPQEALRCALLDWMDNEDTPRAFDVTASDSTFTQLQKTVSAQVDFLIAGHTHLARSLRRDDGGYYFNAGTWMRLIRLDAHEDLQPQNFGAVYSALTQGSLKALDEARPQIVHSRPTFVHVQREATGQTSGTLYEAAGSDGTCQVLRLADPFVVDGGNP